MDRIYYYYIAPVRKLFDSFIIFVLLIDKALFQNKKLLADNYLLSKAYEIEQLNELRIKKIDR